jgi:DNA-binding beta-propeller fold protein YncE
LDASNSVAVTPNGDVFISRAGKEPGSHAIRRVDAKTGIITTITGSEFAGSKPLWKELEQPRQIFADSLGNLYVLEKFRVRYLDFSRHVISTVAGSKAGFGGDGGPATQAKLNYASDLAFDSEGNLYIADWVNNRIRRIDKKTRIITTVAGDGSPAHPKDFPKKVRVDL